MKKQISSGVNNQILIVLKNKLVEISTYGNVDVETLRNALKEELQYYVLNFIYHHPEYSDWIMYGGSALRIIHGLDRMSVDLDFEVSHTISETFLNELKEETEKYFKDNYGVGEEMLVISITNNRGLKLKFNFGEELGLTSHSKQVHIKIDLNHFTAPKTVVERRPINRDQLSFVIKTYNMSSLMASKIAAIFLRGQRGVGEAVYEEKGRDIYDLLWYMTKKAVPDFDYLIAKGVDAKDPRSLFDNLTLQMNKVDNTNLKNDLTPLFLNQSYIENWLKNWLTTYFSLLNEYKIHTVTTINNINVFQDFMSGTFSFIYWYNTEEKGLVRIIYNLSDYWIVFGEGNLSLEIDEKVKSLTEFKNNGSGSRETSQDKLLQYATLFHQKSENYFKKTKHVILGEVTVTKVIRMSADNLNQKEQIVLNKSTLLNSELDDFLK